MSTRFPTAYRSSARAVNNLLVNTKAVEKLRLSLCQFHAVFVRMLSTGAITNVTAIVPVRLTQSFVRLRKW